MTTDDILAAYLAGLGLVVRALTQSIDGVSREAVGKPMTFMLPRGERARVLEIPGFGKLRLHGIGCVAELDSGEDVNFDWDADGRAVFDYWRLRSYSSSIGHETDEQELADALRSMAKSGILEETPSGWFRVL